jgi:hypothetical protein
VAGFKVKSYRVERDISKSTAMSAGEK